MQSFTANQAKTQFGQFLDTAQRDMLIVCSTACSKALLWRKRLDSLRTSWMKC